jgi:hypothetical protein
MDYHMLSQNRLTTPSKAVTAILLMLVAMSGCQNTPPSTPPPKPPSPPLLKPPKVVFSESHDEQIKEIMELARQGRWEEAQSKANLLCQQDPNNPIVMRVHVWVDQQAQLRRAQALEDPRNRRQELRFQPHLQEPVDGAKGPRPAAPQRRARRG